MTFKVGDRVQMIPFAQMRDYVGSMLKANGLRENTTYIVADVNPAYAWIRLAGMIAAIHWEYFILVPKSVGFLIEDDS